MRGGCAYHYTIHASLFLVTYPSRLEISGQTSVHIYPPFCCSETTNVMHSLKLFETISCVCMYTHYIHYSCDFKRKFVKSNGFITAHQVSLLLIMSAPGNSTCTHGWCLCKTLNPSSANKITHQECGRPSIM